MLIPVRCFTCGSLVSDKWLAYNELCSKYRANTKQEDLVLLDADILNDNNTKSTAEEKALKDLEIKRICCRRHFLCAVDMIDVI